MSGNVGGGTNSETTSTDHELQSTKRPKVDDIAHELEKEDWDDGKSRVHAKKGKKGNVSVSNASIFEYGDEEGSDNSDEADKTPKIHPKIYPATKQQSIK